MIHELSHPLAKTLINKLRQSETDAICFRHHIAELARLLLFEALKDEQSVSREIHTWRGKETFGFIDEGNMVVVPILRAGMPMHDAVSVVLPQAASGFLAMKRDEVTHKAELFYNRIPACEGKTVILLDPMVATGGSLSDAIDVVKAKGAIRIISLNLIGSPEGLEVVASNHPDIELYIAQIDERLDENKFILPGLGDAGDRAYNTPE